MTVPYLVLSFYLKGKCMGYRSRMYNLEPQAQSLS
jgi:hypothetical protein